jgi:hypothetical protein
MPIETAVWKLGSQLERISPSALDKENTLEDCIAADPSIIDGDILNRPSTTNSRPTCLRL